MRMITRDQHQARVDAVIDVIREITGSDTVPEAYTSKLSAMSFDELGQFVLALVSNRSVEVSLGLHNDKNTSVAT